MSCDRVAVYVNQWAQTYTAPVREGVEPPKEISIRGESFSLKMIARSETVPTPTPQVTR